MSKDEVMVGLIAAPGSASEIATLLADDLHAELSRYLPTVEWRVSTVVDALVHAPADDAALVAAARGQLLKEGWDLVICLTDLPLTVRRRPVLAHASPLHGVAVVSIPPLGAMSLRRRTRDTVLGLVRTLLGDAADRSLPDRGARLGHRAGQLAKGQQPDGDGSVMFTARVLSGNLRLLFGMIRANQPWKLAIGLSRALTAALATGVFALITPDIWHLGDALGWFRLGAAKWDSIAGERGSVAGERGSDSSQRLPSPFSGRLLAWPGEPSHGSACGHSARARAAIPPRRPSPASCTDR